MTTFVIELDIDGIGGASAAELQAISQKSCGVLEQLGSGVEWKSTATSPRTRSTASTTPRTSTWCASTRASVASRPTASAPALRPG